MKKIIAVALLLSLMLTILSISNAQAASTTSSPHTTTPGIVHPNALTVYCWLPHDIEITNPDATWCISGSGSVNIYNVSKAVDVDTHNEAIDVSNQEDVPVNVGHPVTFGGSGVHVTWVAIG